MAEKKDNNGNVSLAPFLLVQNTQPDAISETALPFDALIHIIQNAGLARHRMLLIDACNSGRMQQQPSLSFNEMLIEKQIASENQQRLKNTVFLSAARGFQSSLEDAQGGYFIQAFLRALRGFARPANLPVTITLNDAYTYAALETRSRTSNKQTPYISAGMLDYDLLQYGSAATSTCESIFDITVNPKTHRSNENLKLQVILKDPGLLPYEGINQDLTLVFHWNLAGSAGYEKNMTRESDGRYWVTLSKNILHSGTLEYWFEFKGGIFRNNFQFEPQNCRWTLRIRQ